MRLSICRSGMLALALLASGCAVPEHVALPAAAREQLAGTEVVMPIRQHEIYVFVPQAQNPNGGLIGAIVAGVIDDVRTGKAETAVGPLRNALVDFDFDTVLKEEMQAALAKDSLIDKGNLRIVKDITSKSLEDALSGSQAPAVLFVIGDYHLSNDADVLDASLTVRLYPDNDALRALLAKPDTKNKLALANTLYRNTLTFQTKIPTDPNGRDAHISAWSANKGEKARAALKLAAVKLSAMLAQDLGWSEADGDAAASTGTSIDIFPYVGQVIARDDGGSLIRTKEGRLEYVTPAAMPQKK